MGIQITVRLDKREREKIDRLIDRGLFASYGHCLRGLLYWHGRLEQDNARLKTEKAQLQERLRLYELGRLQPENAGNERSPVRETKNPW